MGAGRFGIAVGCAVLVNSGGKWQKGVVEHISTTACPGAAQIRVDGKVVLVCPWQFPQLLRPDTAPTPAQQLPTSSMRSDITVTDPVPVAPPAKGAGKGGKDRPEVEIVKGNCSTCISLPFGIRVGRR